MDNGVEQPREQTTAATPPSSGGTDQEKDFVRGFGVDPNDPRLDYDQLRGAVPGQGWDNASTKRLMDRIYEIRYSAPSAPKQTEQAGQTTEARPRPGPQTPETPAARQAETTPPASGSAGTEDEVVDLYIQGEINLEERNTRLRAIDPKSPLL